MTRVPAILGWDIGGVNTKVTLLAPENREAACSISLPFELQRQASLLPATLSAAAHRLRAGPADLHAVTMTAELSQIFRCKREGVDFVVGALEATFPSERLHLYTVGGEFISPWEARIRPLEVAASNWIATARWVARLVPDCILLDVGTTTTDLIPIVDGRVAAEGRTDPERLIHDELVYTGALRTPVEAIARRVPLWGGMAGVSAEGFAISADVYLWLGKIQPEHYTCPTPDNRPATREYAGERLARVVCADRELLQDAAIQEIALELARDQERLILRAIETILQRFPTLRIAVVTGLGEFIAAESARAAGLTVIRLSDSMPGNGQTTAATAVACLLGEQLHVSR
jgi:(4-(4-[2-(gamma-L-glutamylamino)ethyl]phenoxymethyl)furan-2-yl)methanamine synthase